jgi:hypothetical protein
MKWNVGNLDDEMKLQRIGDKKMEYTKTRRWKSSSWENFQYEKRNRGQSLFINMKRMQNVSWILRCALESKQWQKWMMNQTTRLHYKNDPTPTLILVLHT